MKHRPGLGTDRIEIDFAHHDIGGGAHPDPFLDRLTRPTAPAREGGVAFFPE